MGGFNGNDYGATADGAMCRCGDTRVSIEGDIALCLGCGLTRGTVADPSGQRDATSAFQTATDHGLPILRDLRSAP